MRAPFVCQSCRDRHLKCIQLPDSDQCEKCSSSGRKCVQSVSWSFRHVTTVPIKSSAGGARETRLILTFDASQAWVDLPAKLTFIPPNTELDSTALDTSLYEETLSPVVFDDGPTTVTSKVDIPYASVPAAVDQDFDDDAAVQGVLPSPVTYTSYIPSETSPLITHSAIYEGDVAALQDLLDAHQRQYISSVDDTPGTASLVESPTNTHGSGVGLPSGTPRLYTADYALSSTTRLSWGMSSAREARLLHHYIVHCSPWIDICDKQSHFGTEIPKRAAHQPVLRFAIFAFASRHLATLTGTEDTESAKYVSKSLRLMISALNDPLGHWDENLLAGMILLRLHEEISVDDDQRCHLFGTSKLLNSISSFASDGGLRESAAWVSLRQHLYISFTRQLPLHIELDNYQYSSAFRLNDDESWANRIIYLFAVVLDYVLQNGQNVLSQDLAKLDERVEDWITSKPWSFSPLFGQSSENKKMEKPGMWHELYMSHPAHVIGYQYYHLAKITLILYDPKTTKRGFRSLLQQRETERLVREHLRAIVSLSASNETVGNAHFQTSHSLHACGSYLVDPSEQDAAIEVLKEIQCKFGWNTGYVIHELSEQWQRVSR